MSKANIIALLNEVLCAELTAINQYFMHAELCNHWGYKRLYNAIRKESISEMKHAETLIERILFMDGLPNLQKLGKVNIGETVTEQLKLDKEVEIEAIGRLNRGIAACREAGDQGTAGMLQAILQEEEVHLEWIGTQLELIAKLGETNYLTQQIVEN